MKPIKRNTKQFVSLGIKGALMGAADAIPGVSGGTIAFMTGIYEELIYSLKQCGPEALSVLFKQGILAAWKHINGAFLACVFAGILVSVISVSHIVIFLLDSYPSLLWSFFFGLILAAVWSVVRHIEKWHPSIIAAFLLGALLAFYITTITPTHVEATNIMIFVSGMIAICAMILPGISGSFILLLLGMYMPILSAVKSFQLATLTLFASGCVVGLLSFSRILHWMFEKHKTMTLALLGGFMLGSLNKVWPWKLVVESVVNRHGKVIPLVENNVLPATYEAASGLSAQLLPAIALMFIGVMMVFLLEKLGTTPD
ncbi:DUF368 domain-containing protein [Aliiglaciecola sp. 3_MG-2023]|uniref:DUF368 domain-containing protein n=1 Tax=Aliiglaciecola sp. 3_MG-2023 TaxID=3062644 RepID=UPI0026E3F06D|nr:DUF368 domain-containing protein [Aliiglaciecola sp. 3_MG-2023]MDO6692267.1 DUF368 domain-containing protein [Aliiglaciecola sp. 3_MG-2023]